MARLRALLAAPVAAGLCITALVGCGGGDNRDPATFCGRLRIAQSALTDPGDQAALVALYQDLDDEAPLQIKDDWHQITVLLASVTTYDTSDTGETQAVLASVLRSQSAVTAVAVWARDTCRIELGPIPTVVPIGGTGDNLLSDSAGDPAGDPAGGPTPDASDPSATDSS